MELGKNCGPCVQCWNLKKARGRYRFLSVATAKRSVGRGTWEADAALEYWAREGKQRPKVFGWADMQKEGLGKISLDFFCVVVNRVYIYYTLALEFLYHIFISLKLILPILFFCNLTNFIFFCIFSKLYFSMAI